MDEPRNELRRKLLGQQTSLVLLESTIWLCVLCLWQIDTDGVHAALSDRPEREDARLSHLPLGRRQTGLRKRAADRLECWAKRSRRERGDRACIADKPARVGAE